MPLSENGWQVIDSQSSPQLTVVRVPGTGIPGIPLRVQKDCAPLFAYLAARVNKEVCYLKDGNKPGFQDEGGYNLRKMDTGVRFSNHASGTAIDLNWQKWPMFKRRMKAHERKAAELIAADLEEVIRWGGHYSPSRVDEMHWEIRPGVSKAEVRAFTKARGIRKDGTIG